MTFIQLKEVAKSYGEHQVQALSGVSFDVDAAEFVALMGPSGCGKSTLLNMVAGIDRPSAGSVSLNGQDVSTLDDAATTELRRTKIGFVFQFFNLLSTLTVAENVALPLEIGRGLSHTDIAARVKSMLESVSMSHRAGFFPAQLSGGEMQRTAIARALIHKPMVLLADEPTGNLDTDTGKAILDLLRDTNRDSGITILMATHSEEAAGYASRIIRMRDGKVVAQEQRV
ncbi:MAG: ABC transporter ATP-binding protein [Candidatus Obscuribacterales bacterium]